MTGRAGDHAVMFQFQTCDYQVRFRTRKYDSPVTLKRAYLINKKRTLGLENVDNSNKPLSRALAGRAPAREKSAGAYPVNFRIS